MEEKDPKTRKIKPPRFKYRSKQSSSKASLNASLISLLKQVEEQAMLMEVELMEISTNDKSALKCL